MLINKTIVDAVALLTVCPSYNCKRADINCKHKNVYVIQFQLMSTQFMSVSKINKWKMHV